MGNPVSNLDKIQAILNNRQRAAAKGAEGATPSAKPTPAAPAVNPTAVTKPQPVQRTTSAATIRARQEAKGVMPVGTEPENPKGAWATVQARQEAKGVQPVGTERTTGHFYSRAKVDQKIQASQKAIQNITPLMDAKKKELGTADVAYKVSEGNLNSIIKEVEGLAQQYMVNPTEARAAMYDAAWKRYEQALQTYQGAQKNYNDTLGALQYMEGLYNEAVIGYWSGMQELDTWKGTVRSDAAIRQDLQNIHQEILQQQEWERAEKMKKGRQAQLTGAAQGMGAMTQMPYAGYLYAPDTSSDEVSPAMQKLLDKQSLLMEELQWREQFTQDAEDARWRANARDAETVRQDLEAVRGMLFERKQQEQNAAMTEAGVVPQGVGNQMPYGQKLPAQAQPDQQYAGLRRDRKALEDQKKQLETELYWSNYNRYAPLAEAEDFEDKSRYVSTVNGTQADTLYEMVNKVRERPQEGKGGTGWNDYLREDEIKTFNYLYATEGREAAKDYIDWLMPELTKRQRTGTEERAREYATEHPFLASAESVVLAPARSLAYVVQAFDRANDGEIDENSVNYWALHRNSAIRDQVAKNIESSGKWGKAGSFAYQTAMSMADFLYSAAITGGTGWSLAIISTGAAADTVLAAKDRGLSDGQAFALGTVAGLAEAVTEKVSLDALLDASLLKDNALKYVLKNMLVEGSEEVAADVINLMADVLIAQDRSQWQEAIDGYMRDGMSESEAFGQAFKDQMVTMGLDFLGGAISGGVLSGGGIAIDQAQQWWGDRNQSAQQPGVTDIPRARESRTVGEEMTRQNMGQWADNPNPTVTVQPNANVGKEVVDSAQRIANATGRNVVFYSKAPRGNNIQNGYFHDGVIYINSRSQNPMAQIFSHELTHSTEMADAYQDLSALVFAQMQAKGVNLDQLRNSILDTYAQEGHPLADDAAVDKEIVADYVARNLLRNEQSIVSLVNENPSLGRKILNWIDKLLAKLGNEDAQARVFLTDARRIYANALGQSHAMAAQTQAEPQTVGEAMTRQIRANHGLEPEATAEVNEAAEETPLQGLQMPTLEEETPAEIQTMGQTLEEQRRQLDELLRTGEITEEEYEGFLDLMEAWELEKEAAGEVQYSISNTLHDDLQRVLDGTFNASISEVYIGETSNFLTAEIGAKPLKVTMPATKAYSAMATAKQARADNKFDEKVNYHGMGVDGLVRVLNASEDPVAAFADTESEKGSRYSNVVLVTDEVGPDGNYVVVESFDQQQLLQGKRIKANKVITSFDRHSLSYDIMRAAIDGRLLYLDKKRSQQILAGVPAANSQAAIREVDFKKNIQNFWANVKWKKSGTETFSAKSTEAEKTAFELAYEEAKKKAKQDTGEQFSISEPVAGNTAHTDSRGRDLTAEQQAFFSESQARDSNGNLLVLYHQTDNDFTIFDPRHPGAGSYDNETPFGIFLKRSSGDIGLSGKRQMELYANITNPLRVANRVELKSRLREISSEYAEMADRHEALDQEYRTKLDAAERAWQDYMREWRKENPNASRKALYGDPAFMELFDAEDSITDEWVTASNQLSSQAKEIITRDLQEAGYDGIFLENDAGSWGRHTDAIIALNPEQVKQVSNKAPTTNPDIRYSISEATDSEDGERSAYQSGRDIVSDIAQEQAEVDALLSAAQEKDDGVTREEYPNVSRAELKGKARDGLERAERKLLNKLGYKLGVSRMARRENLLPVLQEISDAYLENDTVSNEKVEELFDKAYEAGRVIEREFYDNYKHIKDHLRNTAVTISKQDQSDIADYSDFRKRAFGTLRIVNEGGLPVDTAYQELHGMAPELFPESITHPGDQLQKMYDVAKSIQVSEKTLNEAYGQDARDFYRDEFEQLLGDLVKEMRTVKRYAVDKVPPAEPEEAEEAASLEKIAQVWKNFKQARRATDKAVARNLLTAADEEKVGRLLKGEITLENLDPERDNVQGITEVYEAKREMEQYYAQLAKFKNRVKATRLSTADHYLETADTWKDKKAGILYARETMARNIYDIVKDRKLAEQIVRHYFTPVQVAQAKATRFKNEYRAKVAALKLDTKVRSGNIVSEAHAVQLYGEAMDNIRMLEKMRFGMNTRDGKNLQEWQAVVRELWEQNPNLDQNKIQNAVEEFRKIYDELLQKMNEVRMANGYEPVNYRQGYFPHFQPEGDGIAALFGKALGISMGVDTLPTTINGLTHTFMPGIQWFGNAQERLGFNTAYDAVKGFDKYIEGVASVVHQTENIQNLRALATQVRYRTSDEAIRRDVDAIKNDDSKSEEDKRRAIQEIYDNRPCSLSNFVGELDEYTNLLANKKSRFDRQTESDWGRRFYRFMNNISGRVSMNMINGNLSSATTNFIPLTQAMGRLGVVNTLNGMREAQLAIFRKDASMVEASTFLTNRRGSDPLVKAWNEKVANVLGWPMMTIDHFVSESIVRAAYNKNLKDGLSETEALYQADIMAGSIMADRSKGALPTVFERKNPMTKLFTAFQVEVNNQFSEVFKDMPREYAEKSKLALALCLLKYFLAAFLINELAEKVKGRRTALDPIGIGKQFVEDFRKAGIGEASTNLIVDTVGSLPFSTLASIGLTQLGFESDYGRVPIASAIPDLVSLGNAVVNDNWSAERRWKAAGEELAKPLTYLASPFGGGNQFAKTIKGLKAYIEGGSYKIEDVVQKDEEGNVIGVTGEKVLQYPVFKDDGTMHEFGEIVQAMAFGKSALEEAKEWVESGFKGLTVEQTAVYQDMIDAGVPDRDAYALINEIKGAKKTANESREAVQRDLLRNSGVSGDGKALVYYGMILDSEKERALMDSLAESGADMWDVTATLMDLQDAGSKVKDKFAVILDSNVSADAKSELIASVLGKDLETKFGNPSQYAKFKYSVEHGMSVDEYLEVYTNGGNIDQYLEMMYEGIDHDAAQYYAEEVEELVPLDAKGSVSDIHKWRVAMDASRSEEQQMTMLYILMDDSTYQRVETVHSYGASPEAYVRLQEILPEYDTDHSGGYKQAEIQAAINGLAREVELSETAKAALWQIVTGSTSAKKNPYSKKVGQQIVDAKKAAKDKPEEEQEDDLSFSEAVMQQLLGR